MSRPTVSICIPVYNGEATIEACLKAVLAQNVENSEILIVDNNSTDRTVEIAERLIQDVPNARIIRNETNIGRIENWNRCIEIAEGKYLKFALANDALLKGSVQVLLEAALNDDEVVLVCSWHTWSYGIPESIPEMERHPRRRILSSVETLHLVNDSGNPFWALNGMVINLDVVKANNLRFQVNMPQLADVLFSTQLAANGETIFLDAVSYLFNKGAKNRFHFANIDLASSFQQLRLCTEEAASLLRARGEFVEPKIYERMFDSLKYFLYQENIKLSFSQVLKLFEGQTIWQTRAVFELILCSINGREKILQISQSVKSSAPFLIPIVKRLRAVFSLD